MNKKYRKCSYCQQDYIANSVARECSIKCRLLNRVEVKVDCWEWKGKISSAGYGEMCVKQKHCLTHRLSYEVFNGSIPENTNVCHKCDNKKCLNPEHLWLGTQKENIQDAKNKGRLPDQRGRKHTEETLKKLKLRPHSDRRGEKHHLTKLCNNDVFEIRKLLEMGLRQSEIAKKFDVNQTVISNIKLKKRWAHI